MTHYTAFDNGYILYLDLFLLQWYICPDISIGLNGGLLELQSWLWILMLICDFWVGFSHFLNMQLHNVCSVDIVDFSSVQQMHLILQRTCSLDYFKILCITSTKALVKVQYYDIYKKYKKKNLWLTAPKGATPVN